MSSLHLHSYCPFEDLAAAVAASKAPMLDAAHNGDVDALRAALVGCSEGAAGDALGWAACHADPTCAKLILSDWGGRLSVVFVDRAVEYAAQRGHSATLAALLPYWTVNEQRWADVARWTHDEPCAAMLSVTAEVAA